MTEKTRHWANDPYWTDALNNILQAREDGGRFVTIDLAKIEQKITDDDGPAYRLLEAMKSVVEHESYDGYRGAPRLVLSLLWKLQEMSEEK